MKLFSIIEKGDFNYLKLMLCYPSITFTNRRTDVIFDDHFGKKYSVEFPTDIVYADTRFEDGEKYFWIFWIRIFGFGFGFKRQTSY